MHFHLLVIPNGCNESETKKAKPPTLKQTITFVMTCKESLLQALANSCFPLRQEPLFSPFHDLILASQACSWTKKGHLHWVADEFEWKMFSQESVTLVVVVLILVRHKVQTSLTFFFLDTDRLFH